MKYEGAVKLTPPPENTALRICTELLLIHKWPFLLQIDIFVVFALLIFTLFCIENQIAKRTQVLLLVANLMWVRLVYPMHQLHTWKVASRNSLKEKIWCLKQGINCIARNWCELWTTSFVVLKWDNLRKHCFQLCENPLLESIQTFL